MDSRDGEEHGESSSDVSCSENHRVVVLLMDFAVVVAVWRPTVRPVKIVQLLFRPGASARWGNGGREGDGALFGGNSAAVVVWSVVCTSTSYFFLCLHTRINTVSTH